MLRNYLTIALRRLRRGGTHTAGEDPSGIVIDTKIDESAFGATGPDWSGVIGRTIVVPLDTTELSFTVGAVVEPMPENSSIRFAAAISFENYDRLVTREFVVLVLVAYHSVRAALADPVQSLRYE